jgi:hypothetical protein
LGEDTGDGFVDDGIEIGGPDQDGLLNGGTGMGVMTSRAWR